MKFNKDTQGAIELPAFAELLAPGKHTVAIEMARRLADAVQHRGELQRRHAR